MCPHDPIRSHLCDPGNPYGGPWSKEEGGQGAVPRLLPATEHRAWAGAHAPGALLPRASWTTGAWAPSSRGLFGMSRQLAGPDIKVVGPPRPVSVRSGTRPGSPRPSQRARRASQASLLCGGNGMRMADIAVRGCSGQHRISISQIEQKVCLKLNYIYIMYTCAFIHIYMKMPHVHMEYSHSGNSS